MAWHVLQIVDESSTEIVKGSIWLTNLCIELYIYVFSLKSALKMKRSRHIYFTQARGFHHVNFEARGPSLYASHLWEIFHVTMHESCEGLRNLVTLFTIFVCCLFLKKCALLLNKFLLNINRCFFSYFLHISKHWIIWYFMCVSDFYSNLYGRINKDYEVTRFWVSSRIFY